MRQTFSVHNVKCGGCANTLVTSLAKEYGDVQVNLDLDPREITLDVEDTQLENLKLKLRSIGYPLTTDELSGIQNVTTKAKSFVSCAVGKINSH